MARLSEGEVAALLEALDDEYRAWATYDQVIADFGTVRPFVNIRKAEARHIQALRALLDSYRIPVPANRWPGRVSRFPSLRQACEAGVAAEVANRELYDRLLAVARQPDICGVFRNLQRASQERHLAAFQRCMGRLEGRGGVGGRESGR